MSAETMQYTNIVQDAMQTAQFSQEELARLLAIKNNLNGNGAHDGEEFRLERADLFDEASFEKHITTYLEEYRLHAQATDIEQNYSDGHIRDADGVPMVEKGKRSIKDKVLRNRHEDLSKVTADLLCMAELDNLCTRAHDGETIIYASTPDPQFGYTYGFLYVGQVREITQRVKKITLTSIRLDTAKFDDYNKILSDLTKEHIAFSTPNEALVNPKLVAETLTNPQIFNTIKKYCNFEYDPNEKKKNDNILHKMSSRITDYIRFVKSGASLEERIAGFQTLEKYALELKANYGKVETLVPVWTSSALLQERNNDFRGFISQYKTAELPKATGTCSGSKDKKSANMYGLGSIFGDYSIHTEVDSILEALGFGEESNYCDVCDAENKDSHYHCPKKDGGCGKKYADETNSSHRTEKCSCGFKFHCGNNNSIESSQGKNIDIVVFDANKDTKREEPSKRDSTAIVVSNNGKRFRIQFATKSQKALRESGDEAISLN
ncbi:MAG TPA: hypothetical protein VLG12_05245 [Candidatus Saccharimonadales bacterium]|nr:hypothetical protein [Candidatus Saccharimonadales bacterium]